MCGLIASALLCFVGLIACYFTLWVCWFTFVWFVVVGLLILVWACGLFVVRIILVACLGLLVVWIDVLFVSRFTWIAVLLIGIGCCL